MIFRFLMMAGLVAMSVGGAGLSAGEDAAPRASDATRAAFVERFNDTSARVNVAVREAVAALDRHDADKAFDALNRALVVLRAWQSGAHGPAELPPELRRRTGGGAPEAAADPVLSQTRARVEARLPPPPDIPPGALNAIDPEYQRRIKMQQAAAAARDALRNLRREQQFLCEQATANAGGGSRGTSGTPSSSAASDPRDPADSSGRDSSAAASGGDGQQAAVPETPLGRSQRATAQAAHDLSVRLREHAEFDPRFADMVRFLSGASESMYRAADALDRGARGQAQSLTDAARRQLDDALGGLEPAQAERLAEAMERLEVASRRSRDGTASLAASLEAVGDAAAVSPEAAASLGRAVERQRALATDAEQVAEQAHDAAAMAERAGYAAAAERLEQAARLATRGRRSARQQLADAGAELDEHRAGAAGESLRAAAGGLGRFLESVQDAGHAMASDHASELQRAAQTGERLRDGLSRLSTAALPASDREAAGTELAYRIGVWSRRLDSREFGDADSRATLRQATVTEPSLAALAAQLAGPGAGSGGAVATTVERLSSRLSDEYQAALRTRRLRDAERGECPPRYRQQVGAYFETLARTEP